MFFQVRFELAAKNAELQEKMSHVQTTLAKVKEEKEKESLANYQFEEKMKEKIVALERTVEVSERTRSDRKQEFIESIKELGLFHIQIVLHHLNRNFAECRTLCNFLGYSATKNCAWINGMKS